MVNWEPLRAKWEEENSIVNWNYQAFIFEYNLELVASNWHITQHFEPREEKFFPPSSPSIPATYCQSVLFSVNI